MEFAKGGHSNGKRGYQARPWTHKKHPNHIFFWYEKDPKYAFLHAIFLICPSCPFQNLSIWPKTHPFFSNFARFFTPKRCMRVQCLVLKNNPNYVNFWTSLITPLTFRWPPGGNLVYISLFIWNFNGQKLTCISLSFFAVLKIFFLGGYFRQILIKFQILPSKHGGQFCKICRQITPPADPGLLSPGVL